MIFSILVPTPEPFASTLNEMIKQLMLEFEDKGLFDLIFSIFLNNFKVACIASFSGILLFGIIPLFLAASNGYIVGFVINKVIFKLGLSDGILSLWRLLPHGIFELPAIFIAFGIGINFGLSIFKSIESKSFRFTQECFFNLLRVIIFVIFPLLILAAIIEGSLIFFIN